MQSKILLVFLSAAAFCSCSTAYKSGQTPDDVYYSPAKPVTEDDNRDDRDEVKKEPAVDYEISMAVRDRRWRDFSDDYDYDHSPYNYTCKGYNYGYYYNPFYYPWVIYTDKSYSRPVNATPRMVNLNAYKGYSTNVANGKLYNTSTGRSQQYNNSNNRGLGNLMREVLTPSSSSSPSNNNTRTYSPPPASNNSSSGSSGNNSSGTVTRPGRG